MQQPIPVGGAYPEQQVDLPILDPEGKPADQIESSDQPILKGSAIN